MKKLALALVCLVSVAFFASCDPVVENPEPSITIMTGDNYIADGAVLEVGTVYQYGFKAASNAETQSELAKLVVTCGETVLCDSTISGTEFDFTGEIYFEETKEIIGSAEIKAVVTDAAGETNNVTITVSINKEETLAAADFEWYRLGNTQTGLEEFGLVWENNLKATHAQIKPLEGVKLYMFESTDWEEVTTATQKAALFSQAIEQQIPATVYNNVSTTAAATYDDVIGTVTTDGEYHLIHVTRCTIDAFQSAGYPIHIYGQAK